MRSTRTIVALLALVGLLAVGVLVPALAQDGDDTATETATTTAPAWRAERHEAFVAALAAELDLPESRVEEALAAVHEQLHEQRQAAMRERLEERLAAAVEAGELTQEQADAIIAAYDADVFPRLRDGFGHHRGRMMGRGMGAGMGWVAPTEPAA